MSKVLIQVENTSHAQPESICFFPISSCFARKKTFLNSLRFQEGVAILFFQNHWPDSVLEYCLNLNGRYITFKISDLQSMAIQFLNGKFLLLGVNSCNISNTIVGELEKHMNIFIFHLSNPYDVLYTK